MCYNPCFQILNNIIYIFMYFFTNTYFFYIKNYCLNTLPNGSKFSSTQTVNDQHR